MKYLVAGRPLAEQALRIARAETCVWALTDRDLLEARENRKERIEAIKWVLRKQTRHDELATRHRRGER